LGLDLQYTPWTVVALAGFGVVMGLVAGAYPALVQSRMQPVEIMQDRLQVRGRAGRILVVVQFVASTVFLTTALVVDRQVDHWESLDQGYDPRLVVCIPTFAGSSRGGDDVHESQRFLDVFRREVLPLAGVLAVSGSSEFPDGADDFRFADPERPEASLIEVDPYFLRTLGLELVEGEDFPPDLLASGRVVLVNQQLAATLEGLVVGSYLEGGYPPRRPRIIGVVSDFQHDDPSSGGFVPELVLSVLPDRPIETVLVRVRPERVPETLAELREAWERLAPGVPFSYRFLDDHIAERFIGHAILISLLRWVTGFLVLIACLGVFGMASLAVSRRTKEVAVRKVLGASTASVAMLLSSQSTRLVLIAVVVAIPLTYQLSEFLLRSEVDRIELDLLSYSAGGLIALGLTWLVSGYHAVRAALANPVDSLRSE
jgi:putative ABC transport system permease protein